MSYSSTLRMAGKIHDLRTQRNGNRQAKCSKLTFSPIELTTAAPMLSVISLAMTPHCSVVSTRAVHKSRRGGVGSHQTATYDRFSSAP